ncbi:MAG: envelope integrity protein Cei [Kutzneria sp.]|nr:envelope integrity protein Cei [Kutzneria sp.]MBV9847031.1 envelope integrity protein Cei [Kutzneria sp.]
MAAARGTGDGGNPLYRKRHPVPALALFIVLAVVAGFVWLKVIHTSADAGAAAHCNPPGSATNSPRGQPAQRQGQVLDHDALDETALVAAAQVQVRVLNASGQKNEASIVAAALAQTGFGGAAEPDNDPQYPAGDMSCRGQIRFGPNGASAARTLSIVEPCAELVRDDRQDTTVDFAIGRKFDQIRVNPDAKQVLDQLADWTQRQPPQQGGQLAQSTNRPPISANLIKAARDVHC